VGVFVGQKRWVYCSFPFFMQNLHDSLSCHLSKISCKHATIKFERGKQLRKNRWELWVCHQQIQQST
jgi:hypothetical protein